MVINRSAWYKYYMCIFILTYIHSTLGNFRILGIVKFVKIEIVVMKKRSKSWSKLVVEDKKSHTKIFFARILYLNNNE